MMSHTHMNEEAAIRQLQTFLQQLSFFDQRIPYVPVNGRFDAQTRLALQNFQIIHHLPSTGTADLQTWEKLYAEYLLSLARNSTPGKISPFPPYPSEYAIAPGEESDLVWILRHMLNAVSVDYADVGPLPDGRLYDTATEHAVKQFQRANKLPVTGRVDLSTWNRLAEEYNRLAHTNQ